MALSVPVIDLQTLQRPTFAVLADPQLQARLFLLESVPLNYWMHRQPARVYRDFQREPLDVYQRLVNANYNLNVHAVWSAS